MNSYDCAVSDRPLPHSQAAAGCYSDRLYMHVQTLASIGDSECVHLIASGNNAYSGSL